ncbi:MAG: ABC transporter permease subunit [Acidimicrobiaceae bacterium]|nr:ABC transporter permease subunit [Acidimicrobiaceae bacterium]
MYAVTPLRELFSADLAWPVVVLAVALAGWRLGGAPLATFCTACVAGLGFLGMWTLSMDTLAQVIVAVVMAILCGIPLGVLAARSDRFERMLKPVLDFLQTIPSFVLLVPVIIMFNVGRIPGIIASVLYALPAATRLTNLGIRQVAGEATEASRAFGATRGQTLRKVQLPLAAPSIIAGINQTVMLVLAMVVIAGLVGGGGLGLETVKGLRRTDSVGSGFVAGMAIVLLAMLLDRMLQAWTRRFTPVEGGN